MAAAQLNSFCLVAFFFRISVASYRLWDSRCCGRPAGSCIQSWNSSSCIRPPPDGCCCRTSGRSCSGCARPAPTGPGLRCLQGGKHDVKQNQEEEGRNSACFSPASSSLSFSRSLFGDLGKEQFFSLQRFRSSAASLSVLMANQTGGSAML